MIGAIDIGGTKIAAGIVNETGQILARAECPTDSARSFADGLKQMTTLLRETAAHVGAAAQLRGIGIGCTGPVNPQAGTLGHIEFMPDWSGANLVAELEREFGVTAAIENDADAAALGEAAWGAGRGAHSFIYITVSTGIGGGLIIDSHLYRGVDGAHPEIGHHVIDPSGPLCFCGAYGCWESLASGLALARFFKTDGDLDGLSAFENLDARSICAAAERGDPRALAAVAREAHYLGLGLANLITLFIPDVIALGGGLMNSRHLFWGKIQETIRANCGLVPFEKVRLVPAALGPQTGLAGAAQVWLHHFQS
jgi:glucokinase